MRYKSKSHEAIQINNLDDYPGLEEYDETTFRFIKNGKFVKKGGWIVIIGEYEAIYSDKSFKLHYEEDDSISRKEVLELFDKFTHLGYKPSSLQKYG